MCGIAYYKPGNSFKIIILLKLLIMLKQRGKDSWGFIATNADSNNVLVTKSFGKLKIISILLKIYELFKKDYSDFIFHSGLATSGIPGILENLQPIEINKTIILTHNGLILSPDFHSTFKIEERLSDSNKLARYLSKLDKNDYESFLNSLLGEISVIFLDLISHQIYGYSNVGGLYIGRIDGCTFVSSEILHQNRYKFNFGREILKSEKIDIRRILLLNTRYD